MSLTRRVAFPMAGPCVWPVTRTPAYEGGGWTPRQLPGLALWLDASDASTITEAAGKVSQWDDKSGLGNHATQGTGSAQPTTGTRSINGRNVLDGDGGDWMTLGTDTIGGTSLFADSGDEWMVLAVVERDANGVVVSRATSGNRQFELASYSAVSRSVIRDTVGSGVPIGGAGIIGNAWDGTTATHHWNGTEVSISPGTDPELSGQDVTLFARSDESFKLNGAIGEVIIADTYDAAGLAQAKQYLATKWGITL